MRGATWLLSLSAAWIIAGLCLGFFMRPLYGALWIGVLGVVMLYAIIGLTLWVVALVMGSRRGWPRACSIVAGGLPAAGVILWLVATPLEAAGDRIVFERHFARLKPTYDRIVTERHALRASPVPSRGMVDDVRYEIDSGPPLRVAFPQPGGITDNWEAIIHDPSGLVGTASGWADAAGGFTADARVVKVFGGDLVLCRPISGSYYRCWFT